MIDPNWPHGFELICKSPNGNVGTREARLICTDRQSVHGHKYVFLVSMYGYEEVRLVNEEGRVLGSGENVIIRQKPAPKKVFKGWYNLYSNGRHHCGPYETRQVADEIAGSSRIACLYIEREYEDGEGL